MPITRRTALAATAATLAYPAIAQRRDRRVLISTNDSVSILDPVLSTADVTRDFGYMVFDTLFGTDASGNVQPQMAEGFTSEDSGKRIEITLRPGLRFHDGSTVLASDCVASLRRWMVRDVVGSKIAENLDAIEAIGDRRIVLRFHRAFPLTIAALGKFGAIPAFIMPARLASTDAFKPIAEIVGSGPYRFLPDQWNAGNFMRFARFENYSPTPVGTPSLTAGPKLPLMEQVEWRVLTDTGTAASALAVGEIDWWFTVNPDLEPLLARNPSVILAAQSPFGEFAYVRPNHLIPPFDRVEVRRAVMMGIDQAEFMRGLFGDKADTFTVPSGFFTPGMPMASAVGFEHLKADPRSAKLALEAAGAAGASVTLLSAGDIPFNNTVGLLMADLMTKLGLRVDMVTSDWATLLARRAKKDPIAQGGWNAFCSASNGIDASDPSTHRQLRASGGTGWFGWPNIPPIERLRDDWFYAPDRSTQRAIAADIQRAAFDQIPYWPLGFYKSKTAYRRGVNGIRPGLSVAWNVSKE